MTYQQRAKHKETTTKYESKWINQLSIKCTKQSHEKKHMETQKMAKNKRYCVSMTMVAFNKAHACFPLAIIQNHNLN